MESELPLGRFCGIVRGGLAACTCALGGPFLLPSCRRLATFDAGILLLGVSTLATLVDADSVVDGSELEEVWGGLEVDGVCVGDSNTLEVGWGGLEVDGDGAE